MSLYEYKQHLAFIFSKNTKSRDFHQIILDIYENLPSEDKIKQHQDSFNSLIETWHCQAPELWCSQYGVWMKFTEYLKSNFDPNDTKYRKILNIFNGNTNKDNDNNV